MGFRNFVCKNALALGVCGYVKNLPDSSVQVLASFYSTQEQELFEQALFKGPIFAKVKQVRKEEVRNYAKKGFNILVD